MAEGAARHDVDDRCQNEDKGENDRDDFQEITFIETRASAVIPNAKQYHPNGRKSFEWK